MKEVKVIYSVENNLDYRSCLINTEEDTLMETQPFGMFFWFHKETCPGSQIGCIDVRVP